MIRYLKTTIFLFALILGAYTLTVGTNTVVVAEEEVKPSMTIMIPMRDGTELPTDIYLPDSEAKGLPCILLRGPAGRHARSSVYYANLAKEGYVVAIQDSRAAKDVVGAAMPYYTDGWGPQQDGYDTVEYLGNHALTNGKVGTLGMSNMGITQLLLAPTAPPSLKCQHIGVATPNLYKDGIFPGGQLLKNQVEGWLGYYAKDGTILQFIASQDKYNDFWDTVNSVKRAHQVRVPAIHQGGWFDIFSQGTIDAYMALQETGGPGAQGKQKLLIGPWNHHYYHGNLKLGDFELTEYAFNSPIDMTPKRWFDYHLKGIDNKTDDIPNVIYYVMGPFDGTPSSGNVWKTASEWPVPRVDTPFYLTADHQLVEGTAPASESIITYTNDLKDPVPTIGGRNLFLESGPKDQRPIESRSDVVTFTTAPLEEDVEVTGRVIAKLVFSCDQEDTDVAIRLTDVYPDGRSILIADAIHRTGNMPSHKCGENAKEIDLDLWSTSIVFAKGHRIRVSVTGSNFPRFELNKNSASDTVTHNLHVGGNNASRIILPLVRKGEKVLEAKNP